MKQQLRIIAGPHVAQTAPRPLNRLEIRALDALDAMAFRALWLQALYEQPDTFSASYVEECDRTWVNYMQRYRAEWIAGDNVILGAFAAGQLLGAIAIRRWEREKLRHKGYVWILFVESAARGRGIGRQLLAAGIAYAQHLPGVQQLQLSVAADNGPARALYQSFQFEPYGCERQALKRAHGFVDLELLARYFP